MDEVKKWYADTGSHGDVVLSTRVRLARNIEGFPFPAHLSVSAQRELNAALTAVGVSAREFSLIPVQMDALKTYEAVALAERHLISADFAAARDNRVLLTTADESISIMLNERDHLRMQVIYGGFCPTRAHESAEKLDALFDSAFPFAFDERLGFLTQNPADLGTGMRASVLLHLPALSAQGVMFRFSATASKLGLSVRGVFGEGGLATGDVYQLSNQVTMGLSEQSALQNLEAIALQLATRERTAAEQYITDLSVQDRIRRAHGMLTSAVLLPTDEMLEALSLVRLGAVYGLLDVPCEVINELLIAMQPANINVLAGNALPKTERDVLRAQIVRARLA